MWVLKGNKTEKWGKTELEKAISGFEKVVLDLGTGDGQFVYKSALENKGVFYIGMDPSESQMKIHSRDIQRKKLANALLVVGSIELIPAEFDGLFDEIYVNYPWGTLLESFVKPVEKNILNVKKVLKDEGRVEVTFGYDEELEPGEVERHALPHLTDSFIDNVLSKNLSRLGFLVINKTVTQNPCTNSTDTQWLKKLGKTTRKFYSIILSKQQ